jgi:hypothetical protein
MKILVLILLSSSFVYPFTYDSAIYKAQKGNWQDAHSALSSIITDNPDRADVIYDAGVAAYNLGNRCHAATCFARAAECSADKNVTFCAHFNAGNLYVDEKKLERALEEYDKALAIEPKNEYARHNRDRVVQMLEEQKQQQNKDQEQQNQEKNEQNEEQNNQDQQQDKQDQQSNQGQNQQSQNGNDKQNGEQNQQGNDQRSDNGNEKQNKDGSSEPKLDKQTQGDREQQADATKQRAEHGDNPKDKHHDAGNDKKRNGNNEFDKKAQDAQKEGNQQQRDKHNTTPEKQHESNDKSNGSAQDGQEDVGEQDALDKIALNDPWLLKILDNQEMHDKTVNKQLMEAKIRQHGGKNGQNCW